MFFEGWDHFILHDIFFMQTPQANDYWHIDKVSCNLQNDTKTVSVLCSEKYRKNIECCCYDGKYFRSLA